MYTVAIGDVHGCLDKLESLIEHVHSHYKEIDKYVFLGDYVDRGPDSKGVIDYIMHLQSKVNVIALYGNHEQMLIDSLNSYFKEDWNSSEYGMTTLPSFRVSCVSQLPMKYIKWIKSLPIIHKDEDRVYVHAGINRSVPLNEQSKNYNIWVRHEFLLDPREEGGYVVHGHTPDLSGPDIKHNRTNLDTGSCFGGRLTAGIFQKGNPKPIACVQDNARIFRVE